MLLPKSYAGSLQVALSTQTTTHTAQQPLNGLRTALKKISRSVNAAFSAVPVAKFEQQTAAAAVSSCDRNILFQMVEITKYCFNCSREKSGIRKFRTVVQNDTAELNTCKYWYKFL